MTCYPYNCVALRDTHALQYIKFLSVLVQKLSPMLKLLTTKQIDKQANKQMGQKQYAAPDLICGA